MAYILEFRVDGNVLCVHATGDRSSENPLAAAKDLWVQVALECEETGISRVLLLSEINGRFPTCACYETISSLDECGVSRAWKIAYVNDDERWRGDLMFMAALAAYQGFFVQLFESEAEARKWLIGETTRTGHHDEILPAGVT